MIDKQQLLLIFVKHPLMGEVKTRIGAVAGHEKAVEIYQELLQITANCVQPLAAHKVVFYGNIVPEHDLWQNLGLERQLQTGNDLGERMENAFAWGFAQGFQQILIIGSDCAELSTEILQQGFDSLTSHEFVLGGAKDGGYYLLGMRALYNFVFENKKWSTDTVFKETLQEIQENAHTCALLPTLSDIDTLEDWQQFHGFMH
ncbi:MAG: TIGR04282 family arsenosugar biosynthesis glycosyltransferase [Bacteroidia bacterium]